MILLFPETLAATPGSGARSRSAAGGGTRRLRSPILHLQYRLVFGRKQWHEGHEGVPAPRERYPPRGRADCTSNPPERAADRVPQQPWPRPFVAPLPSPDGG